MKRVLVLILALIFAAGCAPQAPVSNENVMLVLEQSHKVIKVGESVTFTARATGTAGRDEEIKWASSGGEMSQPNGMERYTRVTYEKPGSYSVQAKLYVDEKLVDQQQVLVQVDPLT